MIPGEVITQPGTITLNEGGETLTALDDKDYTFEAGMMAISDGNGPESIAGITHLPLDVFEHSTLLLVRLVTLLQIYFLTSLSHSFDFLDFFLDLSYIFRLLVPVILVQPFALFVVGFHFRVKW